MAYVYKQGDTFEHNGNTIMCVRDEGYQACKVCYFKDKDCINFDCIDKGVHYIKVEKKEEEDE